MAIRLKTFVFFISILSLILSVLTFVNTLEEDRKNLKIRHDYKHTFKKPYYYNLTVPFFDTYGRKSSYSFLGITSLIYRKNFLIGISRELIDL
jgi:hypothetical protein